MKPKVRCPKCFNLMKWDSKECRKCANDELRTPGYRQINRLATEKRKQDERLRWIEGLARLEPKELTPKVMFEELRPW
jgi:ribosomal protein L40E